MELKRGFVFIIGMNIVIAACLVGLSLLLR
jgi:hypothetical protein